MPKVVRLVDYVIVSRSHLALSTGALTPVNKLGYNPLDAIMPALLVQGTYSNLVLFLMSYALKDFSETSQFAARGAMIGR